MILIINKNKHRRQGSDYGFTLIEMLVSLSLFSIVSTIVVGSIVVLLGNNMTLQSNQQVSVGLAAALDNMTREIRTGTYYYCDSALWHAGNVPAVSAQQDCASGDTGISFRETAGVISGTPGGRISFYFSPASGAEPGRIVRRVGNASEEVITPRTINVRRARFYVTGSESLSSASNINSANTQQPTVTIIIEAEDNAQRNNSKQFIIQSTVTQRILDL